MGLYHRTAIDIRHEDYRKTKVAMERFLEQQQKDVILIQKMDALRKQHEEKQALQNVARNAAVNEFSETNDNIVQMPVTKRRRSWFGLGRAAAL